MNEKSWLTDQEFWDNYLSEMLNKISQSTGTTSIGGLGGVSLSLAIASVQRLLGSTLVITSDPSTAESISADLEAIIGKSYHFPCYETLPYEGEPAHPGVMADRIETMFGLLKSGESPVVIAPVQALLKLLPHPCVFSEMKLSCGCRFSMKYVEEWLEAAGYTRENVVCEQGRWTRRGGILDIGTFGCENPVRLEFFGDVIESVRMFDLRSQRTLRKVDSVTILQAREPFITHENWNRAVEFLGEDHHLSRLVCTASGFPGIEHYLPLFYDQLVPLTEYFRKGYTIVTVERTQIDSAIEEAEQFLKSSFPENNVGFTFRQQFLEIDRVKNLLSSANRSISFQLMPEENVDVYYHTQPQERFIGYREEMISQFTRWINEGYRIGVACDTIAELERFRELIPDSLPIDLSVLQLSDGFRVPENRLAVFVERKLLSGRRRPEKIRKFRGGEILSDYDDIQPGDFIVHRSYGIGKFHGLEKVSSFDETIDCLVIEYAGEDRLLVPTDELRQVRKYLAPEGIIPRLDRIGGETWKKKVSKARVRAREVAGKLAVIYAERKASKRDPMIPDRNLMEKLEESFPYEETPDQARAIREVKGDFSSSKPMDRLICGDVGYGKTEVALRAAFNVASSGYQVVVLVPTTVLAEQHYFTFRNRLAEFPVKVDVISRFRSRIEQKNILRKLVEGKTDIIIGTHRLLQKDIRFHRLGFLIIDEEHRFGVSHKEYIHELKSGIDTLSMTATPIPRTLHMSLSGFRDISLMTTSPRDRYPIHTELINFNHKVIVKAVKRELARDGQIFFVHNRISTIYDMMDKLESFMPWLKIIVGHGQMKSSELEKVMRSFAEGRFNVLLSTSIIESGIDMPNVNTIFINNAHTFGLAELYQLRGRVGRSHHRAYAYLIHPGSLKELNPDAGNRLKTIQRYTELGSGWHIAMRDLEIRGAGELLGISQHGFLSAVGYSLFEELIKEEARTIAGLPEETRKSIRIEIPGESFIPIDYMPDVIERVRAYRQVWRADSEENIADWLDFIRDRFGEPPVPVLTCAERARIHLLGLRAGAEEVVASEKKGRVVFPSSGIPSEILQNNLTGYRFPCSVRAEQTGRVILTVDWSEKGPGVRWNALGNLLRLICQLAIKAG